MALIDAIFMAVEFVQAFRYYVYAPKIAAALQLSVAVAFLTYFIFFGKDHFGGIVNKFRHRDFYREMKQKKIKVTKNKDKNNEG